MLEFIERSLVFPIDSTSKLKTIFPAPPQLERFRKLEEARQESSISKSQDQHIIRLIDKFESRVRNTLNGDREQKTFALRIEQEKQTAMSKLKMDYVEEQMTENLEKLSKLIENYEFFTSSIQLEKSHVQKMVMMTEIKRALQIQNEFLKKENENLKIQQNVLDMRQNK